jgi:hypothetical protein
MEGYQLCYGILSNANVELGVQSAANQSDAFFSVPQTPVGVLELAEVVDC